MNLFKKLSVTVWLILSFFLVPLSSAYAFTVNTTKSVDTLHLTYTFSQSDIDAVQSQNPSCTVTEWWPQLVYIYHGTPPADADSMGVFSPVGSLGDGLFPLTPTTTSFNIDIVNDLGGYSDGNGGTLDALTYYITFAGTGDSCEILNPLIPVVNDGQSAPPPGNIFVESIPNQVLLSQLPNTFDTAIVNTAYAIPTLDQEAITIMTEGSGQTFLRFLRENWPPIVIALIIISAFFIFIKLINIRIFDRYKF